MRKTQSDYNAQSRGSRLALQHALTSHLENEIEVIKPARARHHKPSAMIELYGTPGLQAVAKEVEATLTDIMAEAAR